MINGRISADDSAVIMKLIWITIRNMMYATNNLLRFVSFVDDIGLWYQNLPKKWFVLRRYAIEEGSGVLTCIG